MKALLVQPPFAQLNAPYPAVHYLDAFLRSRGVETRVADHSIELYRSVFSRRGLESVFAAARLVLDDGSGSGPSDPASIVQLELYLSYEGLYLEWIDGLVGFLSGGDPAFAHRLAQAAELPRGMRAQAFLERRGGRIAAHEARGLATAVLEDLGDLVSYAVDPSFGTVRYAERIASSAGRFEDLRHALDSSPLLGPTYRPLLEAEWAECGGSPDLLLVTVPFPGSLLGALACARSARSAFAGKTRVLFGGGYVSTELRRLRDCGIFDFCDYLCFDAGYGSLDSILEVEAGAPRERLYRTMYRGGDGRVVAAGFEGGDEAVSEPGLRRITSCDEEGRFRLAETEALASVAPDYALADFGRYLQVADSDNPMHSLWSDSPWLKYGLARGCYWRRCSFCDTSLEYVSRFVPAEIPALMKAAGAAAARTGLRGIHFVDEAMPMASLLAFARENRSRSAAGASPFHFWGNVRFDSSWTEDRCEYLAASGLVAVSGGVEIATEAGLEMTDKGFDLALLVRTLVGMRRAGLLVHAYLIYGFPGQSAADIVDSAEVCRQLFAAELVDSAFWHRFVLTRHSGLYADWAAGRPLRRAGGHPSFLEPIDRASDFADNDLEFAGGEAYDEFDGPLAATLEAWMSGEGLGAAGAGRQLAKAGLRAARGEGGASSVERGFVEGLVARAEAELGSARPLRDGRAHWIAGAPLARPLDRHLDRLTWSYRGEGRELRLPRARARAAAACLGALAASVEGRPFAPLREELARDSSLGPADLAELRNSGLVVV